MGTTLSSHTRELHTTNDRSKGIAEHFNEYFALIKKVLQKHIPPTQMSFSNNIKNANAESFFITPTTPEEISDLIQCLRSNKHTGPNCIPTSILRKIKNKISIPLPVIINNSFENWIFPNLLKSAKWVRLNYATTSFSSKYYSAIRDGDFMCQCFDRLVFQIQNF